MQTHEITGKRRQRTPASAQASLYSETRATVDTAAAAYYLNRSPQTLREWSSRGTGLLVPIRVGVRLAWPVSEIKKLMGVAQ